MIISYRRALKNVVIVSERKPRRPRRQSGTCVITILAARLVPESESEVSREARDGAAHVMRCLKVWFDLPTEVLMHAINLFDRWVKVPDEDEGPALPRALHHSVLHEHSHRAPRRRQPDRQEGVRRRVRSVDCDFSVC
ncbi:Cyclin G [Eumeta japonica]|uniref:Cyclin G n=1 Tax=Eumeta variegata TaxID=151549 RepID=A0A4C1XT13_EUMVA|nr:Cyclin G [Eumeta japonica]